MKTKYTHGTFLRCGKRAWNYFQGGTRSGDLISQVAWDQRAQTWQLFWMSWNPAPQSAFLRDLADFLDQLNAKGAPK